MNHSACEASPASFSRWGIVSFYDDTGLGRQAKDLFQVLGMERFLAVPSEKFTDISLPNWITPLREETSRQELESLLEGLDGILFPERSYWHPKLLETAKQKNLKTVCIPNWEWFRADDSFWKWCDLFLCTSAFTERILNQLGYKNTAQVGTHPIHLGALQQRTIQGPAKTFIHNGGILDADDRKSTFETIKAFSRVKNPDLKLILRLQKETELPSLDPRIDLRIGNIDDPAELYREGDVAIQPSKMEGNGFSIIEAAACGLPVITLDAPPMNEIITYPELRCKARFGRKKGFPARAAGIRQAFLRIPRINSLAAAIRWCSENDMTHLSLKLRTFFKEKFEVQSVRQTWSSVIESRLSE